MNAPYPPPGGAAPAGPAERVIEALTARGRLAPEPLRLAQATTPLRAAFEASGVSAQEFADEVALAYDAPRLSLADLVSAASLASRFSERFLREACLFPFSDPQGRLCVATADPSDVESLRAIQIELGGPVHVVVAASDDIASALDAQLESPPADRAESGAVEENLDALRDLASGAPVVRAFDALIEKAVDLRASDIHIEPTRSGLAIRLRIDGVLRPVAAPAGAPGPALISRLKILAGLNIAERRLPQDGGARLKAGRGEIDVRVATLPTSHGESAVIRLLPRDRGLLEMEKLGLGRADEARLRRALDFPNGMIVITGPTGSGKTTTLATLLTALNSPGVKILTVEDPIEYELPGVVQTQVKASIGYTFAAAMRAFVRHNPNIIMVGEVRDKETADIAVHAALTGHLVLTTLHTETAAGAVPRFLDLGVEPFLLKSTLRLVVAQRLVRVLCERCKTRRTLERADFERDPRLSFLGLKPGETVCEPKGCERCGGTGYRGRVGVFEAIEVEGDWREHVRAGIDASALEAAALKAGMTTMTADAAEKARAGVASVADALRVAAIR